MSDFNHITKTLLDLNKKYPATVFIWEEADNKYRAYGESATILSNTIGLPLADTEEGKLKVMTGFQKKHNLEKHLKQLTSNGLRVAVITPLN